MSNDVKARKTCLLVLLQQLYHYNVLLLLLL